MKLHPEDPRITAYVLGELTPEDAAAVELAAAADPAVEAAIDELEGVGNLLAETLFATKPTLRPAHRQKIKQAASDPQSVGKIIPITDHRRFWKPWLVTLGAAALLMLAIFLFTKSPSSPTQTAESTPAASAAPAEEWRTIPIQISLLPAPGPADASRVFAKNPGANARIARALAAREEALAKPGDAFFSEITARPQTASVPKAADLPPLVPRGSVVAAQAPQLPLPVRAGSASLGWITHSIRNEHKLPPVDAVRIEEILNHFALRPAGATAVFQGVTLSTETLPCPWKPSASLVIIAFRGASDSAREIQANFKADPATVVRYRLLGFSPVAGIPDDSLPTHLPAKALTLVAIEVEPKADANTFGTVEWTVNQQPAAEISLSRRDDSEPSDDARFASLLCTYGQWLAKDQAGVIDPEIVAALAREVSSDNLPPERFDFLNLIDQSLNL